MSLFVNPNKDQGKILSFLQEQVVSAIHSHSDCPLKVEHDPGDSLLGQGVHFFHVFYPVSIFDSRHPQSVVEYDPTGPNPKSSSVLKCSSDLKECRINSMLDPNVKMIIRDLFEKKFPGIYIHELLDP